MGTYSRRDMLRLSGAAAVGILGYSTLTACGDDDSSGGSGNANGGQSQASVLETARQQGFLRAGFANEKPAGFADESGKLTGESPEILRAVVAELGIEELSGVLTEFSALIPGLLANRFDVIAAGMFVRPERCEQVIFSEPTYCSLSAFAVPKGNPKNITNYESIAKSGAKLGTVAGGAEVEYARANGVTDLTEFPDPVAAFDALRAGRVDLVGGLTSSLKATFKDNSNFEITEPFTPTVDGVKQFGCGAFAFRKEDTELRDAVNEKLKEYMSSGKIFEISAPFGFEEAAVEEAASVTTEQLCTPTE